ncbi:MAG: hypothetical protein ACJ73S_22185 [Mycobacteriales bacterium]
MRRATAIAVLLGGFGLLAVAGLGGVTGSASAAPPAAPYLIELKSTTGAQPAQWSVPAGGQVVFKNSYAGLTVLGLISTTPVTVHFSDGRPDLTVNSGATSAPLAVTAPLYYTVNPGLLFVPLATVTDQGSITPQGQHPASPPPSPATHQQQATGGRPAASAPRPAPAPVAPPPAANDAGTAVTLPAPGPQEAVTLPPLGGDSAAPGGGQAPGGDELGPDDASAPGSAHGFRVGMLLPALVAALLLAGVATGLVRTLRSTPLTRRQDAS